MSQGYIPLEVSVARGKPRNPDLSITFWKEENESKYAWRLKVVGDKLGELFRDIDYIEETRSSTPFYTDETGDFRTPEALQQAVYTQINDAVSVGATDDEIINEIQLLGNELYDRLFPNEVKDIYWKYLSSSASHRKINVVIKSAEPWIPWEIVRPYNHSTEQVDDFLCETFNLTRWVKGVKLYDSINLNHHKIIATSHIEESETEVQEISRILGGRVSRESPLRSEVQRLLRRGEYSGLHFICHGDYRSEAELSELHLEDGDLRPFDINGQYTFCQMKPFIFLNACETGQMNFALTGSAGWADAFIRRIKGSGFLGSIWEADDKLACKFATSFYTYLLQGKNVGEAVRLSRKAIKEIDPTNPTWLTYTVYANPMARIARSGTSTS